MKLKLTQSAPSDLRQKNIGRRQDFGETNATKELGYRSSMVKDIGSSSSFSKNFQSFFQRLLAHFTKKNTPQLTNS